MDDLVAWLRTQLDEDERVAHSAAPGPWEYQDVDSVGGGRVCSPTVAIADIHYDTDRIDPRIRRAISEEEADATGEHIARHNPARVLHEVKAKRLILEAHVSDGNWCPMGEAIFHVLALPYADRPGYRDEWKS